MRYPLAQACLVAFALICLLPATAQPATEPPEPEARLLTAAMRREDPRLETKITFSSRHIPLGELLEQLGQQAGVSLAAGERDGAQDVTIACFCKDIPLARMLNALWSCVSYKGAQWSWERSGAPGPYRYRLIQPMAARRLRERLQGWIQERFEANAAKLLAAVDGTDEQKQQALKDIYGNPEIGLVVNPPDGLWSAVRAVKEALTPEQLLQAMRQGVSIRVPFQTLSAPTREYLLGRWQESHQGKILVNGEWQSMPGPEFIQYKTERYYTTPFLSPAVSEFAGPGLFGGIPLEWLFRNHLHSLWLLDDDATDDPAAARPMVKPPDASPDTAQPLTGLQEFERRLEQIAAGAQVPLVARLADDEHVYGLPEPWGRALRDYWKELLWNRPMMVKWREGALLVSTETWPTDDPPIPLAYLRALRKEARPGEYLPWRALTGAAATLTANQLLRLKDEFPVMPRVLPLQGLFTFSHRYPAMFEQAGKGQGLSLTPPVASVLRPLLPSSLAAIMDRGDARYLTLKRLAGRAEEAPSRRLLFQLSNAEGRTLGGIFFEDVLQPRKEQKPPAAETVPRL